MSNTGVGGTKTRAAKGKPRRRRGRGRPTIADVAAAAGVGAMTVSRALRNPDLVSEPLRLSIENAIRKLNYIPHFGAQALARNRSDIIGVLVPSLSQVVFVDVLRGIYDGIKGTSLQVNLGNTEYRVDEEERLIEFFLHQRPAAMIISGINQTPAARDMLKADGCPVVQIMDVTDNPIGHVVGFSHVAGGRLMTEHLIEQGYKRIAFLTGLNDRRGGGRYIGYRQAMAAAGREPITILNELSGPSPRPATDHQAFSGIPDPNSLNAVVGRQLLRYALAHDPTIDAVFCNNDIYALGALFEARKQGLRVPDELGIAGFNDHEYMEAAQPSLSSVHTYRYEIGFDAAMAVRKMLAGEKLRDAVVDKGVTLMARESTRRCRSSES